MKKTIYDPDEKEKKTLLNVNIKPANHKSGLFFAYNEDRSLNCAIWGTPKQLACLYLDLQDRMPEGVIEYANMIRENAQNDTQSNSLETQTPASNRLN